MLLDTFKEKLKLFSDNPEDIVIKSGTLLVQFHDEIIEAKVNVRDGNVFVIENEVPKIAEKWIAKRVARLDILANRILSYIPKEDNYVCPTGCILDDIKLDPTEKCLEIDNIDRGIVGYLERPCEGETAVLYLTSDAGEGKTTIINQIAREQAKRYTHGETDWLILPVALGGKPFMRLDDVIVGTLVNKLRFPYLYYESLIELGRLGYIVLALDGFEEMFIETPSGEAISALGNLLQKYKSSGKILVAARKAYFEFKSLKTQSQLFDTFPSCDVSFAKAEINRWSERQFVEYGSKYNLDAEQIYDQLVSKLGDNNHPLVSRAVLVKRLFAVLKGGDPSAVLDRLDLANEDYFKEFIDVIIEREVNEKWIDRSGDVAKPLLNKSGHYLLLSNLAEEMWLTATDSLSSSILDMIAELTCENLKITPLVTRQIIERTKQHSLIVKSYTSREEFQFDHEEFKWYFLAQKISDLISSRNRNDLRRVLKQGSLSMLTSYTVSTALNKQSSSAKEIIEFLLTISAQETTGSFIVENVATISIMYLNEKQQEELVRFNGLFFNSDSINCKKLKNIVFEKCIFQNTGTDNTHLSNCQFISCQINKVEISNTSSFENVEIVDSLPTTIYLVEEDEQIFDPETIASYLAKHGFILKNDKQANFVFNEIEEDQSIAVLKRAARIFYRSTYVNEDTFRIKLGTDSNYFFDNILPILLKNKIIEETQYKGGGKQKRFRVNVRMADIENSFVVSRGSFDEFIKNISKSSI